MAGQQVARFPPSVGDVLVRDLVRKTAALGVLGIFPDGGDAVAHEKEHTAGSKNGG